MSRALSPSFARCYGLARVARVWKISRASVYRSLKQTPPTTITCRPGPVGACSDAELADHIRRQIDASRLHGEGYRKLWARLRFAGVRASPRRVLQMACTHAKTSNWCISALYSNVGAFCAPGAIANRLGSTLLWRVPVDTEKKPDEQKTDQPKQDLGEIVGDLVVSGATLLAHSAAETVVKRVKKAAAKLAPVEAVKKVAKKAKKSAAGTKAAKAKKAKKASKKSGPKKSTGKGCKEIIQENHQRKKSKR